MYKCIKCGEIVNQTPTALIRCANCANKVFYKLRQPVVKTIKAE